MIPTTLRIMGADYAVVLCRKADQVCPDDPGDQGHVNNVTREIRILEGSDYDVLQRILHEAIHAIDYSMHLGLEEEPLDRLATGLAMLIRDNGWVRATP